jgi:osmoprotectant transport system permease protein
MNGWLELIKSQRCELAEATAAHLDLVGEAILLAVLIGVPLGIVASRSRWLEQCIVGVANVLQTIPSLALLGVLLILFRGQIGKPPALAALVVYSLLPIIKNTILGLKGVDRGVSEAALGMGMTPWQRLTMVELPLAVPVLLGGVRVAAVASVGMATIAAAIGAKGLGSYIFRGISLSDPRLILLGSVPAALLALACDATLGEIERRLDPTRRRTGRLADGLAMIGAGVLLGIGLYGFWKETGFGQASRAETVVIGSKDSAEPILLGHMMADLVEAHTSLHVDRRLNLGGSLVCYNALREGGLDAYLEYSGTALTTILKEPPQNDPLAVRKRVAEALLARDQVQALAPVGFENTFAILMRRDHAERLGIRTISELANRSSSLKAGFGPEFMNRPDGYPGLVKAYGLSFAETPRELDRNLLYQAVAGGTLDVAAGDSTDGRVASLDLVQLTDDRRYFPPYEAIPLVRAEALKRHPQLRPALDRLAGQIDEATMRQLNHQVDGLKRDPAEVARQFLEGRGLIGKPRP